MVECYRMMLEAAAPLNLNVKILAESGSPASQICSPQNFLEGDYKNLDAIRAFAKDLDILTCEIEHINLDALVVIQKESPQLRIQPDIQTVRTIQDKYVQKLHFEKYEIPGAEFADVDPSQPVECIKKVAKSFGYPLLLKAKKNAYDGRGNAVVKSAEHIEAALKSLSFPAIPVYVEKMVTFEKEVACMVAKSDSEIKCYPAVETIQKDGICHLVIAPAQIDGLLCSKIQEVAQRAVQSLSGTGIFGVEMFLCADGIPICP